MITRSKIFKSEVGVPRLAVAISSNIAAHELDKELRDQMDLR
jgi:hypothetical protein